MNYGSLFEKYLSANDRIELTAYLTNDALFFVLYKGGVGSAANFTINFGVFDTIWNHIVFVINRITDKAIVYVNTIKDPVERTLAASPADCSNIGNISWGARPNGTAPYEGALDELRIYTGVPTQEIINWLYWEPYAIFKSWRRRYQFFPDRMFLTFTGRTSGLAVIGADMGLTITGDRG